MNKYLSVSGSLIFLFSLYLAFARSYSHFYEFLVLGLFLLLLGAFNFETLDFQQYLILYLVFIAGGLFGDLVLGLWLSQLWSYTYTALWEYVLLYLFIYPVAGIVMVQSYLLAKRFVKNSKPASVNRRNLLHLAWLFTGFSVVSAVLLVYLHEVFGVVLFGSACLSAFFWFSYKSERFNLSYVRDVLENPAAILLASAVSTFGNALIHEIPNIYARQWIYAWSLDAVILSGWPFLMLIPISAHYFVVAGRRYLAMN